MSASKKQDFYQIPTIISGLRGQARARLMHEVVICAVAASLLALAAGVALFAFAHPALWLRLLVLAAWLGSVVGLSVWRLRGPLGQLKTLRDVGSVIESHFGDFRNDITASLQFEAELDKLRQEGNVSAVMVEQLLTNTQDRLSKMRHQLPDALPAPWLGMPYGAAAVALVVLLGMGLLARDAFVRGARGLIFGPAPAVADGSARQSAIIGDIVLTYNYPDYTDLGRREIYNATGDIEVLKGTQVEISGIAMRPVQRAEIVFTPENAPVESEEGQEGAEEANGEQRILLQRRPGNRLVASFAALQSGTYTVEALLTDGDEVYDGITRTVRVIIDEDPRISIISPNGEVDVSPQDAVTFKYEASDDFGLTELAVVTSFGGDEKDKKRVVIETLDGQKEVLPGDARPTQDGGSGGRLQFSSEHILDLVPYNLRAKDRLVVYLEAVDNDTTSGPKVTASSPVVLKVSSPEDKHLEIIASQEEIFEALLDVLGDYLEKPIGDAYADNRGKTVQGVSPQWEPAKIKERFGVALGPHAKKAQILEQMAGLMDRMEQDPLMLKRDFELFSRTHKDLQKLHLAEGARIDRLRPQASAMTLTAVSLQSLYEDRRKTIHGTERAIITLEDLIASQRMENAMDTAKDMKEAVERLKELMKKYKETQDPDVKAEIMREIMRMRERMRELMQKMQAQIKKLPQEHVNMEAMDREGMANKAKDASDSLEELMKALEQGDMDKAMSMLDQMSQSVDDMLGQMQEEFDEMQPEGLSELDKKVSEVMDELNDLQAQEQQLAKETDEINRQMEAEQREKINEMVEEFAKEQLERAKELRENLEKIDPSQLDPFEQSMMKRMQKSAERLEQSLEQQDMAEAMEQARELAQDMQSAESSMNFRSRRMRPGKQKEGYDKARQKIKGNRPSADQLARDLERMMQQARPQPNAEQSSKLQELSKRQQQVRERTQELREKMEGDAQFPMLGEQLAPGLGEAEQFMEGAQKSLKKREGGRAHESEKLAMDKIKGLKDKLKQTLKEEKMGGQQQGRKLSQEKVEIPEEDRKAPREFREDIMEAMKEGGIESYESELQEYYESLVR